MNGFVQASNLEINAELKRLNVLEVDGKLRLVSKAAIYDITRAILDEAIEQSWSLDHITANDCLTAICPLFHPSIITLALSLIGEELRTGIWRLHVSKVAVVCAHILFNTKPVTYQVSRELYRDFPRIL